MPVNMRENSNSTQGSTRRTLSKQPSENSNEGSASMKIQFTVRQHPSGDRYIITPRSVQEHRSPGYSADTQRSTRSTPGGMRFLETEDPEEYQRYYMGWRGLATSKADREAETLLYNQLSRNPMSRFVESRGSGEGAGRTWERGATPQPAPKKPLSLKEKRQRHLERMKRGWGVTDSGADKNAELSTEDFLNASNSSSRPASAQRRPGTGGSRNQLRSSGSREVQERGGGASGSRAGGVESSSRVLGQKQHTQQGGSAGPAKVGGRGGGVTAAGRPWSGKRGAKEKGAPFATQDPSNGGSGGGGESEGATPGSVSRDGHRLAREARDALASLGIQRPLTGTSQSSSRPGSHQSSPAKSSAKYFGASQRSRSRQDPGSRSPDAQQRPSDSAGHGGTGGPAPMPEGYGSLYGDSISEEDPTFGRRLGGAGTLQATPPPPLFVPPGSPGGGAARAARGGSRSPVRMGRSGSRRSMPSPASSEAWEDELDALLEWTDTLGAPPT